MIYRAQFCYPTPPGCRDEDFVYYFDGSNTPMLNQDVQGSDPEQHPLASPAGRAVLLEGDQSGIEGRRAAGRRFRTSTSSSGTAI